MSRLFLCCWKIPWKCQVLVEQSVFFLDVKLNPDKPEKKHRSFVRSFFKENKLGDRIWSDVAHKGNVDTLLFQVNLQKTYSESCLRKPTPSPLG